MAGVTDLPFRVLCAEQGAGLVCMEMVSAKAIYYKNRNTEELMETDPGEHPVSLQLFGSDPVIISEMAKRIEEKPFDILDINMGCPVPKVVNNGEGSALMKNPKLVEEIISRTVKAIHKPVTVKFRKGFDEEHIKAAVSIPVFGNGDVTDGKSAAALLQQTGCDGVMIGRAVRGNPWIFREINHYLDTGELPERPTADEVCNTILRHAQMELELKGEYTAVREMRKHIAWYTAGYPRSAALRRKVNEIEDFETLKETVQQIFTE